MEEVDIHYNSDEEISEKEHGRLLEAVSKLDKTQHIKKPTRTEPSLQVTEYNLVNVPGSNENAVHLRELIQSLNTKSSHTDVVKKVNKLRRKVKTLPKPLEKPQAQRIKRAVGFENVKKTLNRWEPIVTANRAVDQLKFPIPKVSHVKTEATHELISRFRIKSELQLELEKVDQKDEEREDSDKEEFPLTLKEILERRKEGAKLRAQQSYKEAKARRQNKIKSKKYHRIQRREKIKQQLKEFELLQKTNPEEALKKLEEIEKARAEERMSLRHRSTGQWARNKQIRAKYDKESRQVLAQQLAVSRDLTQKLQNTNDSSDDSDGETIPTSNTTSDTKNPWVKSVQPSNEIVELVSGYRKFWDEKNKNESMKQQINKSNLNAHDETQKEKGDETFLHDSDASEEIQDNASENDIEEFKNELSIIQTGTKKNKEKHSSPSELKKKKKPVSGKNKKENISKKMKKKPKASVVSTTNGWAVESLENCNIDDIFHDFEYKMKNVLTKKAKAIQTKVGKNETSKINKRSKSKDNKTTFDLSLKSQRPLRPNLDEGLIELHQDVEKERYQETRNSNHNIDISKDRNQPTTTTDIDPYSFIKVQPTLLPGSNVENGSMNDALDDEYDDIELSENQQNLISEAFEDDDIVDDFQKEKADEVEGSKPQDVDLSLPGWGSWGGTNIKPNSRKRKRFIIKMPTKVPRKDDNKGNLIIKEFRDKKLQQHQVSEVPFPFTSVKAFEASIRAPISNTFISETAHRRLTKPAVLTQAGAIIEPMDESQLVINHIKNLKKSKKQKSNKKQKKL